MFCIFQESFPKKGASQRGWNWFISQIYDFLGIALPGNESISHLEKKQTPSSKVATGKGIWDNSQGILYPITQIEY